MNINLCIKSSIDWNNGLINVEMKKQKKLKKKATKKSSDLVFQKKC